MHLGWSCGLCGGPSRTHVRRASPSRTPRAACHTWEVGMSLGGGYPRRDAHTCGGHETVCEHTGCSLGGYEPGWVYVHTHRLRVTPGRRAVGNHVCSHPGCHHGSTSPMVARVVGMRLGMSRHGCILGHACLDQRRAGSSKGRSKRASRSCSKCSCSRRVCRT